MVKKKSQLNDYKYIIGIVATSVLVSIALVSVAGRPLYASLKKTNLELDEKRLVLRKLETNLETLKGLDSKKAEIEEKNQKVLAALPSDKDLPRLFTQLEKIAKAAGFNIDTISETAGAVDTTEATAPVSGSINTLTYQVSGDATNYGALKSALAKVESGLRIVSINKVNAQSGQDGGSLTVDLTVSTFTRGN